MNEQYPRCVARGRDYWNPEPEDPFWMLEAEDGEWLKNGDSMLGTRDASKAIRFPTERAAYNHPARMTAGYKWWSAKPTEHKWIEFAALAIAGVRLPPFADAWAKKEAQGFRYNGDALENVALGYEIARAELDAFVTPQALP